MTGEQGTFWEGIRTAPFKNLRSGTLSEGEKRRRHRESFRKWYRQGGSKWIKQYTAQRYAENPALLEKSRARSRRVMRERNGVKDATGETRTGPCGICKKIKKLHCDHDHVTGRKRGWLCPRCNTSLEWALEYMQDAQDYVKELLAA